MKLGPKVWMVVWDEPSKKTPGHIIHPARDFPTERQARDFIAALPEGSNPKGPYQSQLARVS